MGVWRTVYYTDVPRTWPFLALLLMVFAAGCDRGAKPPLVGDTAPAFTVKDDDRSVSLEQFRGKVVVLNFWATWCPPCVEEMPSLVQLQKRMGDRVVVLGVSNDTNKQAYDNFLKQYGVDFLTVRDPRAHSNALYGTRGLPETFVIDQGGVVRRKFVGPLNWTDAEIVDFLTKLSAGAAGG